MCPSIESAWHHLSNCSGFYIDRDIPNWGHTGHPRICMLTKVAKEAAGQVEMFRVRRPNNKWLKLELSRREVREL